MNPFNAGDPVYSPTFGKGVVLGVIDTDEEGTYHMLVRFESLNHDVPYFYDGSRYGRDHPNPEDIAIEAEWREIE
nr:MAG TPA: ATP-dependent DNA helicase [Caudoviricetes sp.]